MERKSKAQKRKEKDQVTVSLYFSDKYKKNNFYLCKKHIGLYYTKYRAVLNLSDHNKDKIAHYIFLLTLLFVLVLPLKKELATPVLILWFLLWLIKGNYFRDFKQSKKLWFFFSLVLFYFLHVFGMLNTTNVSSGMFDLEVKLSLLFFPLVFVSAVSYTHKFFNRILGMFVVGNTIAAIICICVAFYRSIYFIDGSFVFNPIAERLFEGRMISEFNFFYERFSCLNHTSYFSMYLVFSIVILNYFIDKKIYFGKASLRFFYYILIPFFLLILFLISSKAGIAIVILLMLIITIMRILKKKSFVNFLMFFLIIVFSIVAVKYNTRVTTGVNQIKATIEKTDNNNVKLQNDRFLIWEKSLDIIKDNFIFGVGTGDYTDELMKVFKKNNMNEAFSHQYNSHNQYIDTFIGLGIIGLINIVFLFVYPCIYAFQRKQYLFIYFLLIMNINFLFESMLNRQAGVIFYAFFFSLLAFSMPEKTYEEETNTMNL